ncbi:MAG: PEP-CTERM sorting domain-containing protein [Phycisphaerales bacterium]
MKNVSMTALALCAIAGMAQASVVYTTIGGGYSQNFDSLTTATTSQPWTNDTTLTGWNLFRRTAAGDATPVAITSYTGGDGGTNAGSFYSFGSAGSSERAFGSTGSGGTYFGSPASGVVGGWIAVALENSTGAALSSFTVGFNGEQWRNGGNTAAQPMVLEYGFGLSFNSVATWTAPGANFDWSSVVNATAAAAVDGNAAGLVAGRGGTISNVTWNPGENLWIRWTERNDTGNDHGLAIDNFSFSAIPTPGSLALAAMGLFGMARRRRA